MAGPLRATNSFSAMPLHSCHPATRRRRERSEGSAFPRMHSMPPFDADEPQQLVSTSRKSNAK